MTRRLAPKGVPGTKVVRSLTVNQLAIVVGTAAAAALERHDQRRIGILKRALAAQAERQVAAMLAELPTVKH